MKKRGGNINNVLTLNFVMTVDNQMENTLIQAF